MKHNRATHLREIHPVHKCKHLCHICGLIFESNKELVEHISNEHPILTIGDFYSEEMISKEL